MGTFAKQTSIFFRVSISICAILIVTSCGGGPSTPQLKIDTASLPNGISLVAYRQTIQASGGVAPFSWSVNGALPHNLALHTSSTNTVTISGTPDTPSQAVAFAIKVKDSANTTTSQTYTVSILLESDTVTLAPMNLSFAPQPMGTSSGVQTETVNNTGASPVVISGLTLGGIDAADFRQTNSCGSTLEGGANCTINLAFTPGQLGPRSAALTVNDNTQGSPHSVDGVGLTSGVNASLSASTLIFSSQIIASTSAAQTITLNNWGTATLNISGIVASAEFAEKDNCSGTLVLGSSCMINVTFTPATSGSVSGTLTITDNASNNPQTVSLSGTGVAGMCVQPGRACGPAQPCCAGLQCVFSGGSIRAGYSCK